MIIKVCDQLSTSSNRKTQRWYLNKDKALRKILWLQYQAKEE